VIALPSCVERGAGKHTLVFLHGIGGDHRAFDDQLATFSRRARAIAWDMPGYGTSPALEPMTFPALADALALLLDELRVERAVLVGHSMGGMVAQELVARCPDRVAALVLYSTSPAFGGADGEWQRRFLAERLQPLDEGKTPADIAPGLVHQLVGHDTDARAIARALACMSAIPADTYRAALHCVVGFDRRESLAAIRCPTLALGGERDRIVPPTVVERMARAIPGARYEMLAGVGHLANLERPAEFDAVLGRFIDSLPS
jgi:3-oxoadipate enol-lactonase